jgi:hypothetical protein
MTALAFISDDGSGVAFVFADDDFSAVRNLAGSWRSPAPDCKFGDFEDGYTKLSPKAAEALIIEARTSVRV